VCFCPCPTPPTSVGFNRLARLLFPFINGSRARRKPPSSLTRTRVQRRTGLDGYITITNDYHVAVSRRIRDEFSNGKEYYALEGKALQITPQSAADRPSKEFLEWHQNNCFRNQ
jgi:hypothetical protein